MSEYRTFHEVTAEYFVNHPDEIESFIETLFEDYAEHGDAAVVLSALRVIARVKGITLTADEAGMTRQGLQKALSPQGNPRLDTINAILKALGYRLTAKRIETDEAALSTESISVV